MENTSFLDYYNAPQQPAPNFLAAGVQEPEPQEKEVNQAACPGDEPEVLDFLTKMYRHGGQVELDDHGSSVGIRFSRPLTMENAADRRSVADALFTNATIGSLLHLLPDGCFDSVYLAWFAGRRPSKGQGSNKEKRATGEES